MIEGLLFSPFTYAITLCMPCKFIKFDILFLCKHFHLFLYIYVYIYTFRYLFYVCYVFYKLKFHV